MKIKPVVSDHIRTTHTSFTVDFYLEYNITFICGDSGTGKSAVFSFIEELATEDNRIKCFNYRDYKTQYTTSIKRFKGKLIVIDNADILLNDNMRNYIAFDGKNQYIIIGRNPTGLQLEMDEIFELKSEKLGNITLFTLEKSFN